MCIRDSNDTISIFYPDTAEPLGELPVIVFSAGWNQPRAAYEGYATQFAQWGYIGVIRAMPTYGLLGIDETHFDAQVDHQRRILDLLAQLNENAASPLCGMIDTARVGATGHSVGGGVALRSALRDDRVIAAAPLDVTYENSLLAAYRDDLASSDAALLYIRATHAGYCGRPLGGAVDLFDLTSAPTLELSIQGADHMDFEDSLIGLNYGALLICPHGPADPQAVRDITSRYMIAWFNVYLKGLDKYRDYFDGPESRQDIESGLVAVRAKL